jgi:hypothetical protein
MAGYIHVPVAMSCAKDINYCPEGCSTCERSEADHFLSNKNCLTCVEGLTLRKQINGDKCINCITSLTDFETENGVGTFNYENGDVIFYKETISGAEYCSACIEGCVSCDNSATCLTCHPDLELQSDGTCIGDLVPNNLGECDAGFYLDESANLCLKCHSLCETCDGPGPNSC